MRKKLWLISSIFLMIIFVIFLVWFLFIDKNIYIKLNGDSIKNIDVFTEYEELGARAYYKSRLLSGKEITNININSEVDTNKIGKYKVYYEVNYNKQHKVISRIVNVIDNEKPIIESMDKINICPNKKLENNNYEYKATDNYDGDITDKVSKTFGSNMLYLEVTDSSNNITTKSIELEEKDMENPIINLVGDSEINLVVGDKYKEPGYNAIDNCDGDITNNVDVISNLDVSKVGDYIIKYVVTDSSDNKSEVVRKIRVKRKQVTIVPEGSTIYLTFDDGPSRYTGKLLDVLKKYNIKATFFVTNQSWDDNLIKRMYSEGHSIGIHTYTHKYGEIYSSEESYFEDLNKLRDKIYNSTGYYSNIVRFPGGSSNTVSSFNAGIMTRLAKKLESNGYKYFDWNVESNDTSSNISSDRIANNIINSLGSRSTYIILQHDTKLNSVNAVEKVIKYGIENGYKFSALDETSPTIHHGIAN